MSIRPASINDAPAIAGIVERAYTPYVSRIGRRPAPMDDDYAAKIRHGQVFVAESDRIAGVIVLIAARDHVLIENVAVDPERQHRGIGRALMAYAEAHAEQIGVTELRLYTNQAMHENLVLYSRLGYVETGRRSEEGFSRVYLQKRLDPKPRR